MLRILSDPPRLLELGIRRVDSGGDPLPWAVYEFEDGSKVRARRTKPGTDHKYVVYEVC